MKRHPSNERLDLDMTKTLSVSNRTRLLPLNPYLVLLVAILLPGFGYALCGEGRRGFTMQMFMIALAFTTWYLAPSSASFIGKLAGGRINLCIELTRHLSTGSHALGFSEKLSSDQIRG